MLLHACFVLSRRVLDHLRVRRERMKGRQDRQHGDFGADPLGQGDAVLDSFAAFVRTKSGSDSVASVRGRAAATGMKAATRAGCRDSSSTRSARKTASSVEHLGIKLDLALNPYQMSGGQQQLVSILRAALILEHIAEIDGGELASIEQDLPLIGRHEAGDHVDEVRPLRWYQDAGIHRPLRERAKHLSEIATDPQVAREKRH